MVEIIHSLTLTEQNAGSEAMIPENHVGRQLAACTAGMLLEGYSSKTVLNVFYFMCLNVSFAYMCVCPSMYAYARGGQKRMSDPLELILGMVVGHHVGVGDQTQVFCKNSQCSKLLCHLSRAVPSMAVHCLPFISVLNL